MKLNINKKYKSLLSDTIAFTISNFASKILVFLLIPLYTAVLTTNEYGIADLILNIVNVLYPVLTLSIMESTLRFTFEKDISQEDVLSNSLHVIILSEIIIIALYPIARIISLETAEYWIWTVVIFLGSNLQQVIGQFTKGIGKTKVFAMAGVIQTFVIIISNIMGLLVFKMGLNAYLFSIVLGHVITIIYLLLAAKIRIKIKSINWPLMRDMLKFSIPTIPAIIAWWVSTSADKYIIIGYLGMALSGIYSIAYKIPSILTMFTNIFTSAWTISAIKNVNDDENEKFQTTVYKYFNIITVSICSILILMSQMLGKILFSKDFYIAWKCVPMLLVAYVFSGLAGFLASSFRAAKYTKGIFSSAVIGAFVNIILNFPVIKYFGIMGAAITTMIGFAVTFYMRTSTITKVIDIKIDIKRDSMVYILLIIQAVVIGNELPYSYIWGVIIVISIGVIYRETYKGIWVKGISMIKDFRKKKL